MKYSPFIIFLFLFLSNTSYSQFKISGKIIDEKKQPAGYVTILVVNTTDTAESVATQSTLDGIYTFEELKAGTYRITTSSLGYSPFRSTDIKLSTHNVEVPVIQISPDAKQLKDVTIYHRKKFLEQRADKLIVNVEASPGAAGATAMEVLRRVPGVQVQGEKISIIGKNKVSVMIDGKISQYVDMNAVLRDIPSSNISKIEVITNPSAKNEAEGGAIINILMKKNTNLGTNGSISFTQGGSIYNQEVVNKGNLTYHRTSPTISLNHRNERWNFFGNYGYLNRSLFEINLINRQYNNDYYDQKNYKPTNYNYHNIRAGADYEIDSLNTLGFLINGFQRVGGGLVAGTSVKTDLLTNTVLDRFTSNNDQQSKTANLNLNFNWKHQFKQEGRSLNIDADMARFDITDRNEVKVKPQTGNIINTFQLNKTPINIQTLKTDYSHPISKNSRLQVGLKTSFSQIDNQLEFRENEVNDPLRSNKFKYTENINALYFVYHTKLDKWDFQAGLRAEQTVSKGKIDQSLLVDSNYILPFPSLLVTRHLDNVFALTAQYSRRIDRPKFQQQNPFEFYIDPLTYTKGNPTIKPQLSHSGKLSLTYSGLPFLVFTYDKTNDVIFDYAPQQRTIIDSNNEPRLVSYTVADNLGEYQNFSTQINFPIKYKDIVDGHGGGIISNQQFNAFYLGSNYNKNKWSYTLYSEINIKLGKTLSSQLSGYFASPTMFEFIETKNNSSIDFGLEKKILNRLGSITLNVADIFSQNKTKGAINYQDINVNINQYSNTRNIRLTFNYSFGNQKLKGARKRKTATEEDNKRVDTN